MQTAPGVNLKHQGDHLSVLAKETVMVSGRKLCRGHLLMPLAVFFRLQHPMVLWATSPPPPATVLVFLSIKGHLPASQSGAPSQEYES